MTIAFQDLRPAMWEIRFDINAAIADVIDRGIFLGGEEVAAFEESWAAYCGAKYCVACASGTDALMLAALAIPAAGCVIQANTCSFTHKGLRRHRYCDFVDCDERGNIGMIPVGVAPVTVCLYGRPPSGSRPAAAGSIARVSWPESFVMDCCQAHGFKPPENAIAAWSGYPTKNLGGFGDCGWVTTNSKSWQLAMKSAATDWHSRMSELNAAVLRTKLPHLDRWNAERAAIAEVYYNELPDWCEPACRHGEPTNHHIFAVLVERRDELKAHLEAGGVGCKIHYAEPLAELLGARRWANMTLSLPMFPGLKAEQVRTVCDVIKGFA